MGLDGSVLASVVEAVGIIHESKYVTALTGAGVSVESGIRPFRGPGGLWTERGEPPMDGYQRFLADPAEHWKNTLSAPTRDGSMLDSKPNTGHLALAELEGMGVLRCLITQNIDGLHSFAGNRSLLEIHGNARKLRCIECDSRFPREGFSLEKLPPRCPRCGGIVKGDTVMFGEPIPRDVLRRCFEEAERSDCMIVAGTSAVVQPAAGLPVAVKRRGGKLIEVNPTETELTGLCDVSVRAQSGLVLPAIVEGLKRATSG